MMGHSPASIEDALAELALCAIETTGFRADAISHEALARVLRKELATGSAPEQVGADARQRDPRLVRALHQSISVGETFFFRQPEQFAFLADHVRGQSNVDGRGVRAWSAGCATGEEAYSLSATLLDATVPGDRALPSVIGTDLVERNVLVARLGVYRP